MRRAVIAAVGLGVVAAVATIGIAYAVAQRTERDGGEQVSIADLGVGDCVNGAREAGSAATRLPTVSCTEPHESEVFAVFALPEGDWPGEDSVLQQADAGCYDRLPAYDAGASEDPSVFITYLYPTDVTWAAGDREVICMTYYIDGERTGSLRG